MRWRDHPSPDRLYVAVLPLTTVRPLRYVAWSRARRSGGSFASAAAPPVLAKLDERPRARRALRANSGSY